MPIEKMADFFKARADTYDGHMLTECGLAGLYEEIAELVVPARPDFRLLDLGCGTGLELERLFAGYPDMRATGIDLSPDMLERLRAKFPGKSIEIVCGSYFDIVFASDYDYVLSTESFHHFDARQKRGLYKKIRKALKPGGMFILGDYTASTQAEQDESFAESARLRLENNIPDGEFCHIDTPFTAANERRLMEEAGFADVKIVREWENTSIITGMA
ncbi:MAG: methyltransferase domain-containing protein [Defluviitaleaceae bacterium]|nr:methyltransferase domain-containing protein [Defluviitaleaceae bacterium]